MDKLYKERLLPRHQDRNINQQLDGRSGRSAPDEIANTQKGDTFSPFYTYENTEHIVRTDQKNRLSENSDNRKETEHDRMLRMRREERFRRKTMRRTEEEDKMTSYPDPSNVLNHTIENNEELRGDVSTRMSSSSASANRLEEPPQSESVINSHQGSFLDALGGYEQKKRHRGHFDHAIPQQSPIRRAPSKRDQTAKSGNFTSSETRAIVDCNSGEGGFYDKFGGMQEMRHRRPAFDPKTPVVNHIERMVEASPREDHSDLFSGLGGYEQEKKNNRPFDHRIPSPRELLYSPNWQNERHCDESDRLSKLNERDQMEREYYEPIHGKGYVIQHNLQNRLFHLQQQGTLNPRSDYAIDRRVQIPERENQPQQQILRSPSTELERKKAQWREEQKILERLQEQELRRIKEERQRKVEEAQRYAQDLAQQLAWNSPSREQRKSSSPKENSYEPILKQRDYPRGVSDKGNWEDSVQRNLQNLPQHTNSHPQVVGKMNRSIDTERMEPRLFTSRELQIERLRNAFEKSDGSAQHNTYNQKEKHQGGFMNKLQRMMDGRDEDSIQAEKEKKRRYREELERQMKEQRREREARMSAFKDQDDPISHTRSIGPIEQNVDRYIQEETRSSEKRENDPEHSEFNEEGSVLEKEEFIHQQRDIDTHGEPQRGNSSSHTKTEIAEHQHHQMDEIHNDQMQQDEISLIHEDGRVMRGALMLSNPGEIERRRRKQQMQEQLRRDLDEQMERAKREKEAKEAKRRAREEREERLEKEMEERLKKENEMEKQKCRDSNEEHAHSGERQQAQNSIHQDPKVQLADDRKPQTPHHQLTESIEEPEEPSMDQTDQTGTEDAHQSESLGTEEHDTTQHNCGDENFGIQDLKEMEGRILNNVLDVLRTERSNVDSIKAMLNEFKEAVLKVHQPEAATPVNSDRTTNNTEVDGKLDEDRECNEEPIPETCDNEQELAMRQSLRGRSKFLFPASQSSTPRIVDPVTANQRELASLSRASKISTAHTTVSNFTLGISFTSEARIQELEKIEKEQDDHKRLRMLAEYVEKNKVTSPLPSTAVTAQESITRPRTPILHKLPVSERSKTGDEGQRVLSRGNESSRPGSAIRRRKRRPLSRLVEQSLPSASKFIEILEHQDTIGG